MRSFKKNRTRVLAISIHSSLCKINLSIFTLFTLFALSLAMLVGCGPQTPERSEFSGEVVTKLPEVPGADERYPLPKLEAKLGETKELSK